MKTSGLWIAAVALLVLGYAYLTRYEVVGADGDVVLVWDRWMHRGCAAEPGAPLDCSR